MLYVTFQSLREHAEARFRRKASSGAIAQKNIA
jgi:hypothetical protein